MAKKIIYIVFFSATIIACTKNAVTGRSQFKLLPESSLQSLSLQEYQTFLSSHKVVNGTGNRDAEMVRRVGQRITRAVENYYASKNLSKDLEGYKWEYNLVDDKTVNAWCMPGGKIVVYTGLLPISQNEAALAIVLGHEVSHAIFQHGNERMSQSLGAQAVELGLDVAMQNKPAETRNLFLNAYGVGATIGLILPFSRKHEYEADHYGLYWAALAGYNPQEAIPFWERMQKSSNGQKPPEFLSTHPDDGNRIKKLQEYMPEALKMYKPINN
jgi:predicted Zn-dependent protease